MSRKFALQSQKSLSIFVSLSGSNCPLSSSIVMTSSPNKPESSSATENGFQHSDQAVSISVESIKPFGLLSLIGMGYAISNTAITCIGSLAASLGGGGRVVFIWGLLIVFVMALWSGDVVTAASGTLAIPQFVLGMAVLVNPSFVIKPLMVFAGYQITNIAISFLNLFERLLPKINIANVWISIVTTVIIVITLLATTQTNSSAKAVFVDIDNVTGWPDGAVFISASPVLTRDSPVSMLSLTWLRKCSLQKRR
ncbi:hypothetical protein B0T10DRAFT_461156 [Thelonectria olida]|uniref:Uncharacterized protein n=1 Tax=Thelonectria olida TaxID=1576542 RepID=A0A9P8W1L8_9HYPO|nr:hypothetical protein B0T10DRAFT_461156 [Thelonectria olida]